MLMSLMLRTGHLKVHSMAGATIYTHTCGDADECAGKESAPADYRELPKSVLADMSREYKAAIMRYISENGRQCALDIRSANLCGREMGDAAVKHHLSDLKGAGMLALDDYKRGSGLPGYYVLSAKGWQELGIGDYQRTELEKSHRKSKHDLDRDEWKLRAREFCQRGNGLPQARLNAELVQHIRATRGVVTIAQWATETGCHIRTIEKVRSYASWSHVPDLKNGKRPGITSAEAPFEAEQQSESGV